MVDRLWPRGLTKERAAVKLWLKDVAPSTELRKWFGHDPAKWKREEGLDLLNRRPKHTLTLVYGARNEEHNEAVVLKRILEGYRMEDEL